MSSKSQRKDQDVTTPAPSQGAELDAEQDFGSNAAAAERMEAAADAADEGPILGRILNMMPVQRGKYAGDEDTKATIMPGKKKGLAVGDKAVAGGLTGAVQKVFPTRATVLFYDSLDTSTRDVTIHRGEKYSRKQDEANRADKARRRADEDAEEDREDEYRTRRGE